MRSRRRGRPSNATTYLRRQRHLQHGGRRAAMPGSQPNQANAQGRLLRMEGLESRLMLTAESSLELVSETPVSSELMAGEIRLLATGPHPHDYFRNVSNNTNSADTVNANVITVGGSSGLELSGAGYTVGVWEAGATVLETHQEFGGRVNTIDPAPAGDHATHVAGTIGASGVEARAQGIAPGVDIRSYDAEFDTTELLGDGSLVDLSNHSYAQVSGWLVDDDSEWGVSTPSGKVDVWVEDYSSYTETPAFGKYSDISRDLDEALFFHDTLLSVWSASNEPGEQFTGASGNNTYATYFSVDPGGIGFTAPGYYLVTNAGPTPAPAADGAADNSFDTLPVAQSAKNNLVVGAVDNEVNDPFELSGITDRPFSSRGPTDDGRIKPDVVAGGVDLYSSFATSDTAYDLLTGTSMAAPSVTGVAALLLEHYENEFNATPLSSTSKGLLIHTAGDIGNPGPDYTSGWGLVNAAEAAEFITSAATDSSAQRLYEANYDGTEFTQSFAADGNSPLKATLVWTDPDGTPHNAANLDQTTSVLVNDLDLWITGPDGVAQPWTLNPAAPDDPAVRTAANHVDNVEQVLIDAPKAGVYTIHIGDTGGVTSQDYSLLLSGAVPTIELGEVRQQIDDLNLDITGVTIVTHGHDPFDDEGDSMLTLAEAIRLQAAAGADPAWLLDHDTQLLGIDPVDSTLFDPVADLNAQGELVLLYDWAAASRLMTAGWHEAAGDLLFATLVDLGLADPAAGTSPDLHFIGVGTGAVVTSEAIERLAFYEIAVDHLTYLDPHDFDQGQVVDGALDTQTLAQPAGYSVAVWDNVDFADVYYQTRGENNAGDDLTDTLVPQGRPIPGAVNYLIGPSGEDYLPDSADYGANNVLGDHRYLWEGFYLSTINGDTPEDNAVAALTKDTPEPATAIDVDDIGFSFGRIKNTEARPTAGNFFDSAQSHSNTDAKLIAAGDTNFAGLFELGLTPADVTDARWQPLWNPIDAFNSGFDYAGDRVADPYDRKLPGWSNLGSTVRGSSADVALDLNDRTLELSPGKPRLVHNKLYIDEAAEQVTLDVRLTGASANDQLVVKLGTNLLGALPLTPPVAAVASGQTFDIPDGLRGQVHELIVELDQGGDGELNAKVEVSNIRLNGLAFNLKAGDLTGLDLASLGSSFTVTSPLTNADRTLLPDGSFSSNGILHVAPVIISSNGVRSEFVSPQSFDITIDGDAKTIHLIIEPGYSTTGDDAVTIAASATVGSGGTNNSLDVYRVQQRLRWLNFRGENNDEVTVDGNGTDVDFVQAIRLFTAATQADGQGNPATSASLIGEGGDTHRWLNSPLAPGWTTLRDDLQHPDDYDSREWTTTWTHQLLENATAARPDLLRSGPPENHGFFSLTQYPDPGPLVHGTDRAGLAVGLELAESLLPVVDDDTPIDTSQPFDLNQPAITAAEREVIRDILAVQSAGVLDIRNVLIGGSVGLSQPVHQRLRTILGALGIPATNVAGHHEHLHINFKPPQAEEALNSHVQTALLLALAALRDDVAAALGLQDSFTNKLFIANDQDNIRDLLPLEQAFDDGLYQPVFEYFNSTVQPTLSGLMNVIDGLAIRVPVPDSDDLLSINLVAHSAVESHTTADDRWKLDLKLGASRVTAVNRGDEDERLLPALQILDPEDAANHIEVGVEARFEVSIPQLATAIAATDVTLTREQFDITARSFNVRDYRAQYSILALDVVHDPVVANGQLEVSFDNENAAGQVTLADLQDPFLATAVTVTSTTNEFSGVLNVHPVDCNVLPMGAEPMVTFSDADLFDGLAPSVLTNPDFALLLPFNTITLNDVFEMIDSLQQVIGQVSDVLEPLDGIPFVASTLDGLIDFNAATEEFANALLEDQTLLFTTVQDMVGTLTSALGLHENEIRLSCDATNTALLLDIDLERDIERMIEFDFASEIEPLSFAAGIDAKLQANLDLDLTLGFSLFTDDLTPGDFLSTPLTALNGGTGVTTLTGQDDLEVTLRDGTTYLVDLDGLTTVNDAFTAITTPSGGDLTFTIDVHPDTGFVTGFTFLDASVGTNLFTITPAGSSPAGSQLGMVGIDGNEDGTIAGVLRVTGFQDRFFITEDSSIDVLASLTASDIDASFGVYGVGGAVVNGSLDFAVTSGLEMIDPGAGANNDGRVTLRELFDNPLASTVNFDPPDLKGSGRLPIVAQPAGLNALLGIDPLHVETPEDDGPEMQLEIASIHLQPNQAFQEVIDGLRHFSVNSVCDGVSQIAAFLRASDFELFNTELPLINQSVNELIDADGLLTGVIESLCFGSTPVDPAALAISIQQLLPDLDVKITALLPDLTAPQQTELTDLRDTLDDAINQTDLAGLPTRFVETLRGMRNFLASLPDTVNELDRQLLAEVLNDLDDLIPDSVEGLKVNIEALLPELDSEVVPVGAIPNIFGDLDADQKETITQLREGLAAALGQADLSNLPTQLSGIVHSFRDLMDSLPGSVDTSQLSAVVDEIDELLPTLDKIETFVEDVFGIDPADFTLELVDLDNDPLTFTKGLIARLTLDTGYTGTLPLDFELDTGSEVIPVGIDTGGEVDVDFTGTFQLDFGLDLSDEVSLADRFFLVADTTELTLEGSIGVEDLTGSITLGGVNLVQLGSPTDAHVELKATINTPVTPATGDGSTLAFTLDTPIVTSPVSMVDVAFVSVDGVIQDSSTYTLSDSMLNFMAGHAPANGAVVEVFSPGNDPASFSVGLNHQVTPDDPVGDPHQIIRFSTLFDGSDTLTFVDDWLDLGGIDGMLGANLPVDVPLVTPFDIRGYWNLADPLDPYLEFPSTIEADLGGAGSCNLPAIVDGIGGFLDVVETSLTEDVLGKLPIVGDNIDFDQAGNFIHDFRNVLDPMLLALGSSAGLRSFLYENLGPGTLSGTGLKLDILVHDHDANPATPPEPINDINDIGLGESSGKEIWVDIPTSGSECVAVNLHMGGEFMLSTDFDLGLEAFVFDVNTSGGVELAIGYDVQVGFGVDKVKGAYFLLNDPLDTITHNSNTIPDPELEFTLDVQLLPGTSLDIRLFFLQLSAQERPFDAGNPHDMVTEAITGFHGEVLINLTDPGDDGELKFSELFDQPFGDLFDLLISGEVIVDLTLEAATVDPNLPSIKADLFVSWGFDIDFGDPDPFMGSDIEVSVENLRLDLGQYVTKVVRPVVDKIDEILQPLDPIIAFFDTEIPLISEVSQIVGQGPVRVVDLIALFGDGAESVAEFVDTVIDVRGIVSDLAATSADDTFEIAFGDFLVTGGAVDPREPTAVIKPSDEEGNPSAFPGGEDDLDMTLDAAEMGGGDEGFFAGILNTLREFGVVFPLLEEPTMAFDLLFGQPVDLVTYDFLGIDGVSDPHRLEAGFGWSQTFGPVLPPVPLFVNIFANFTAFADFKVGFDTAGFQDEGQLIDGLFFEDINPVLGLEAEFGAGAELNAGLVWGGVNGGVAANIGASWNDINEDTKFRLPELVSRTQQGLHCIFDLEGSLDVFLEAYGGVGINVFGKKIVIFEKEVDILDLTIFEFSVGCPPLAPPELGHMVGSELVLNIGPHAPLRQSGAEDGDDNVSVTFEDGVYTVGGFNHEQEFTGVSSILVEAGLGDDQIVIDPSVAVPVVMYGGAGDDNLTVGTGATNTLFGGEGNDRLTGGTGIDLIYGEAGDDLLFGKDSADTLIGGEGNDSLQGDGGNDLLEGGAGNDDLSGGAGNDLALGQAGNDHLSGGNGDNTLDGGDGNDSIEGGDDATGFDLILAGAGNDLINGNAGDDIIMAGAGNDIVLAGAGADQIHGEDGSDELDGGTGNDIYFFATVGGALETDVLSDAAGLELLDFTALSVTDHLTLNLTSGSGMHTLRKLVLNAPIHFENVTGGAGNDTLIDNAVSNTLTGGLGDDTYTFGAFGLNNIDHVDTVVELAGEGTDTLNFAALPASDPVTVDLSVSQPTGLLAPVVAVHTTRTVEVGSAVQRAYIENVTGGSGDDLIYGNNAENLLLGNPGEDTIFGEPGNDLIRGNEGDDTLHGGNEPATGGDTIFGGAGLDVINGNDGADQLFGDSGDDIINGNMHNDTIEGGAGVDLLFGNTGDDTIRGGTGNDVIEGNAGADLLEGGRDADLIWGNAADNASPTADGGDTIEGGAGEDILLGQSGNDVIRGGPHRDFMLGDIGDDHLLGGSGHDLLSGGADSAASFTEFSGIGGGIDTAAGFQAYTTQTFGDRLDGGPDHDLLLGGNATEHNSSSTSPTSQEQMVLMTFADMFTDLVTAHQTTLPGSDPAKFDADLGFVSLINSITTETTVSTPDQEDILLGGYGNDLLIGHDGADYLFGEWGTDTLLAYRIGDVSALTDDYLEGGPDSEPLVCGTHGTNVEVGGTTDLNVDRILVDPGVPPAGPFAGGYFIPSCFIDDVPQFITVLPVAIHGQKFNDANGNGLRDAGEEGLDGWTIGLYDVEQNLIAETVTSSVDLDSSGTIDPETEAGLYWFTDMEEGGNVQGLTAGAYIVAETPQVGFAQTLPVDGTLLTLASGDEATAIDITLDSGPTVKGYVFGLNSGINPADVEIAENINFGNAPLASISGFKWEDLNGNGTRDEGEPLLTGWSIQLHNTSGLVDTVITDADGKYEFTNVLPGDYDIVEIPQSGWSQTFPGASASFTHDVTVDYGSTAIDLNFGNAELSSISGTKWNDLNGNGEREASDLPVDATGAITVNLYDADGLLIAAQITDASGEYTFSGLLPGVYTVEEIPQTGWVQTFPGDDSFGQHQLVVTSGDVIDDLDFGNYEQALISGVKFNDLNGNGAHDTGEPTLPNWEITLSDADGNTTTVTTDGTGAYQFTSLPPGEYTVAETLLAGWVQTFPEPNDDGIGLHELTIVSGDNLSSMNFGNVTRSDIHGLKWHDLNGNGVRDIDPATGDPLEPGLANWLIFLDTNGNGQFDYEDLDGDGQLDNVELNTETEPFTFTMFDDPATPDLDETGMYWFTDLLPGSYTVLEVQQSGFTQTFPTPGAAGTAGYTLTLDGQVATGLDFGDVQTVSIHGMKFHDTDGDGTRDQNTSTATLADDELGLNNWRIELLRDGVVVDSMLTADYDLDGSGSNGLDDDGDWDSELHDLGADGLPDTSDTGEGDGQPTVGEPNVDEPDEAIDPLTERGLYWFTDLLPGEYTIREVPQAGWTQSPLPPQVPPVTASADGTYQVTLSPGETLTEIDFGNSRGFTLRGTKWSDLNGNGSRDQGEPALSGRSIYLDLDGNGQFDSGEPTTLTQTDDPATPGVDETGHYRFTDLLPGFYIVAEDLPTTEEQTYPAAVGSLSRHLVNLAPGAELVMPNLDFGNKVRLGQVHGEKWEDLNRNGIREPGEPGLGGVTIYVDFNANGRLDAGEPRTVSMHDNPVTDFDETGHYWLMDLPAGRYAIREVTPAGSTLTSAGRQLVYSHDFESGSAGAAWSRDQVSQTALDNRSFLGPFGNETVSLTLPGIPAGLLPGAYLEFDLYVFGSWDGNGSAAAGNADLFRLLAGAGAAGSTTLLATTFSNDSDLNQAYPDMIGVGDHPAGTGASETNTLGLGDLPPLDSVYQLGTFSVPLAGDQLQLEFMGEQLFLNSEYPEQWGLDNVRVTVGLDHHTVDLGPAGVAEAIDFGNTRPRTSVAGRHIFYNDSEFDGNSAEANPLDDQAIAPAPTADGQAGKTALLPGQTASFENYTSYARGINGVMVDLQFPADAAAITATDFEFRVGNSDELGTWTTAPTPSSVTVRTAAGTAGSDRITITWPDGAIRNQWLQITLLANDRTGLDTPEVHYWGNAIGETGDSADDTFVNGTDFVATRKNPHTFLTPAPLTDNYDMNRDQRVNASDLAIIRENSTVLASSIRLISPGVGGNLQGQRGGESNTHVVFTPQVAQYPAPLVKTSNFQRRGPRDSHDPLQDIEPNDTLLTAQSLDDASWCPVFNENIGNQNQNTSTTVPHVTIVGTGNNTTDFFSFQATAESRGIFDIDFGAQFDGTGGDFDSLLRLYDPDGNLVFVNDNSAPSAGELGSTSDFDAFFTYTFTASGTWTIEVAAAGQQGEVRPIPEGATYELQVSIENHELGACAPVAVDDAAATSEDQPITMQAPGKLANDTDANDDSLTVVAVNSNTTLVGVPFTLPSGAQLTQNADGSFTYDPAGAFDYLAAGTVGTDSYTYTISDGQGGTDTATCMIRIVGQNDPPVAVDDAATTTPTMPVVIDVLANDTDPDGDPLMVTGILSPPATGQVSMNAEGTLTYSPDDQLPCTEVTFTYTISDSNGGTDQATVTVTILSDEPGQCEASVHGMKWHDLNGNGKLDQGEPGIADVIIYADLNGNGLLDGEDIQTSTMPDDPSTPDVDEQGHYWLEGLPAGDFTVAEVVPAGFAASFPAGDRPGAHFVRLQLGQRLEGLDFGNYRLGSVSGLKFLDAHDCFEDYMPAEGDLGLGGITIYADLNNDGELNRHPTTNLPLEPSTTTAADGTYTLDGLPLGSYVIREELTGDLLQSFPETGFHAVTISQSGQQLEGLNFGNYQPIILPDGSDHLFGTEAGDTLYGDNVVSSRCIVSRGDDDHLYGQQGDDLLVGQLRSDTYHFDPAPVSGVETDTVIELAGLGTEDPEDEGVGDRLDFSAVIDPSESVTVDLTGGLGGNTIATHAGGGTHEVETGLAGQQENIEHILGGSADDTLTGNAAHNWINGGPGSDLLVGNAGDDTYAFDPAGPADVDTIVETTGNDTLDFSTTSAPLAADLSVPGAPPVTVATVAGQTVQADPSLLENVLGGSGNDVIIGNALDNQLEGRAGNDTLTGTGGNDMLVGGDNDDLYLFGNDWGDDTVVELASGGTDDVLDFTAVTRPLLVELGSVTVTDQTFPANVVTHADDEIERIDLPTGGSNTIVGADVPNLWLITGPGEGTLNGIAFTSASDLIGGTDVDQFHFMDVGFISGNVSGGSGNDQFDFTADTASNVGSVGGTLIGGLGIDQLLAPDDQGPNAWLIDGLDQGELAGVGRFADIDLLQGSPVADTFTFTSTGVLGGTLDGGSGTDVLDFTGNTVGNSFIAESLGTLDGLSGSVAAVIGSFDNVDQLLGSSTATDSLSGGSGNDLFELTGAGSGLLNGTPFANFEDLLGLIGADELRVSAGVSLAGQFFGGAGSDTVVEIGASGTFVIDGTGIGSADGVLFSQVVNLLGGSGADTFSFQDGGSLSGTIDGAAGHDLLTFADTTTARDIAVAGSGTIDGALGLADLVPAGFDNIDELNGSLSAAADTLRGGSGPNTFDLTASSAGTLDGIAFANFENFDGGGGNDLFDLAAGILIGGTLDGGLGSDTLDYADFTTAVTVDLNTGTAEAIAGGVLSGTTGSSIEHVLGSLSAGNTLLGDDDHNQLTGGAAADLLEGRLGDDTLTGGTGNDQYQFVGGINLGTDLIVEADNADTDTLDFSAFGGSLNNLQLGSNALQLVDAALLQLTLSGTEAIENVIGTALADMITGNNRDNEIQGGDDLDVIFGSGGDDHLFGNNGDDTLFGGLGADTLEGGPGVDVLDAGGDPGDVEIP